MYYAMCYLPNVPLRLTPEDGGEMATELLFGDACLVYEADKTWARIKNKADGYEGWVTTKMLTPISEDAYVAYNPLEQPVLCAYYAEAVQEETGQHLLLTGGSLLPEYRPDGSFRVKDSRFRLNPELVGPIQGKDVLRTAMQFLNSPYLWGGKNALGIDCSGLTQVAFRMHGVQLLRNSSQQATQGELVPFLSDARPGDLAFFDHGDGHISHVGIVADNGRILHATGNVHFDKLDAEGIYSEERGFYTHQLRLIRRVAI